MWVAGIDYSTHAVDVVYVHLDDLEPPRWNRWHLEGKDAFDRSRDVAVGGSLWDDVVAFGIEDPRGQNAGALYRVQGAIISQLPWKTLVHPLIPSQWRKLVGLPGNANKGEVDWRVKSELPQSKDWPQDACDAYCIALATRTLLERENQ